MKAETEAALSDVLARLPVGDWGEGRTRSPVLRLLDRMQRGGEDLTADVSVTGEVVRVVMTYRSFGQVNGRYGWLPHAKDAHAIFDAARIVMAEREYLRLNPCPAHTPEWWCPKCEPKKHPVIDLVRELRDQWQTSDRRTP